MEQSSFSLLRESGIDFALPQVRAEGPACAHALGSCFFYKTKGRYLMRRMGGIVLTVTGFLACPCPFFVTVPLVISGLSRTAVGSFLSRNTGLVTTFAGIYFVVALADGEPGSCSARNVETLRRMRPVSPAPVSSATYMQERSPMPEDQPAPRREDLQ
jgi:hypothetical protein